MLIKALVKTNEPLAFTHTAENKGPYINAYIMGNVLSVDTMPLLVTMKNSKPSAEVHACFVYCIGTQAMPAFVVFCNPFATSFVLFKKLSPW